MKNQLKGIYKLRGAIQNYAWGGQEYISKLIGKENTKNEPFAEYWIGVHPRGRSQIKVNNKWEYLDDHASLPYLLKILDVDKMLSIQSHPNKKQAEIGFASENEADIPLDAKYRLFKDDNHKPELMMALGDFWLLHGFKSIKKIEHTIADVKELTPLKSRLRGGLKSFFSHLCLMSQGEVTATLSSLKLRLLEADLTDKNHPDYWAKQAFDAYGFDRGIFSIYFYNLVHLSNGQAIYQEAGVPHAYLEGQNVEIMANSDNVFRAGLTPKHVDVKALLEHLVFEAVTPKIIEPSKIDHFEEAFYSPASEFELHIINLFYQDSHYIHTNDSECYIVLSGSIVIHYNEQQLYLDSGECFFATENIDIRIDSQEMSKIVRSIIPAP